MVPAHRDRGGSLRPVERTRTRREPLGDRRHGAPGKVQRNCGADYSQAGRDTGESRRPAAPAGTPHRYQGVPRRIELGARMNGIGIEPQLIGVGAAVLLLAVLAFFAVRAYQRRARRKSLLARLERVASAAAHQVLVPDGMGGFIHIDHILLTPRGILILDTRRVAGLIFGGDQMSDWTVMGRSHRYTFDNPQPALYDRIAAVKAIVGEVPVEGRLLFSNVGKFTKGIPKWVMMLDSIEVEFPPVTQSDRLSSTYMQYKAGWDRLLSQLRESPHQFTSL